MVSKLKKRLVRGGFVATLMRLYALVVNLVLHAFLARTLSLADYGILIICLNSAIFISTIALGGLNQGIIKLIAGTADQFTVDAKRRLVKRIIISWLGFAILICVGGWFLFGTSVGAFLDISPLLVLLTFCSGAVLALEQLCSATLRSIHAISDASLFDGKTGGPITKTIYLILLGIGLMVGITFNVSVVLMASVIAFLVIFPLIIWIMQKRWLAQEDDENEVQNESNLQDETIEVKDILALNFTFLQTQLLMFLIMRADIWIAGSLVVKDEAALYGAARWLILQTIAPLQIVSMTITSSIAQLHATKKTKEMEAMLRVSASVYSAISIPILLFMCIFGSFTMSLIYGQQYHSAGYLLSILALGQIVNCLTGNSGQALLMTGHAKVNVMVNLTTAVLLIVLGWFFTQHYGINGLVCIVSILVVFRAVALWYLAKRVAKVWTHPTLKVRKMQREF